MAVLRRTIVWRAGQDNKLLEREDRLAHGFCRGFSVGRRANAEAGTWGVSAETLGPHKKIFPPLSED